MARVLVAASVATSAACGLPAAMQPRARDAAPPAPHLDGAGSATAPARNAARVQGSAMELLERTRAQEERVRTLRAHFVATIRRDGDVRESEGALVVAKPSRFRMRLLLPFGLTAADVLVVGDRTWLSLPQGNRGGGSDSGALLPEEDLRAIFLRGEAAWPGRCAPVSDRVNGSDRPASRRDVSIECRDASDGPPLRTARIDPNTAAVRQEVSFSGNRPRTIARHDDFRSVEGFVLPFRITLEDPQRRLTIEIRVVRYEVNPTLAATLFAPPT